MSKGWRYETSQCKDCGGTMIGDGYSVVLHCEFAHDVSYEFHEPDANPVYCGFVDTEETLFDQGVLNTQEEYEDGKP